MIIYIIKYMKGNENDREGTEISEPVRNDALPFLMYGCPALPGFKSPGGRRRRGHIDIM